MTNETAIQPKTGSPITQAEQTRSGWHYRPNVDIVESSSELTLYVDMPGTNENAIDVRFENGTLTLHGAVASRQPDNCSYLIQEYGIGDFHRTFEVGESIDDKRIAAEYRSGVLVLHLPKTEAARPRKIVVQKK